MTLFSDSKPKMEEFCGLQSYWIILHVSIVHIFFHMQRINRGIQQSKHENVSAHF